MYIGFTDFTPGVVFYGLQMTRPIGELLTPGALLSALRESRLAVPILISRLALRHWQFVQQTGGTVAATAALFSSHGKAPMDTAPLLAAFAEGIRCAASLRDEARTHLHLRPASRFPLDCLSSRL